MKPGRPFTKWCEIFPSLSSQRSTLPATLCACQQLRCSRTSHQRQSSLSCVRGKAARGKISSRQSCEWNLTFGVTPNQGNQYRKMHSVLVTEMHALPQQETPRLVSGTFTEVPFTEEERAAGFGKLQPPAFLASRAQAARARAHPRAPQLAHVTLIDSPARRSPSHRPSAAACQSQRLTAPHWLACAPRSSSGTAALRAHRTRWRRWGAGGWAEKRAHRGRARWAGRSPALAVAGSRQRPTLVRRTRLAERPRLRLSPRRPWRLPPPPLDSGGALVC